MPVTHSISPECFRGSRLLQFLWHVVKVKVWGIFIRDCPSMTKPQGANKQIRLVDSVLQLSSLVCLHMASEIICSALMCVAGCMFITAPNQTKPAIIPLNKEPVVFAFSG